MLNIILLGYAHSLISSRIIAKACETNIHFISMKGDVQPHYTLIGGCMAKMHQKFEPLFIQVLIICDEKNLIGRNMFAIDRIYTDTHFKYRGAGLSKNIVELRNKEGLFRLYSKCTIFMTDVLLLFVKAFIILNIKGYGLK